MLFGDPSSFPRPPQDEERWNEACFDSIFFSHVAARTDCMLLLSLFFHAPLLHLVASLFFLLPSDHDLSAVPFFSKKKRKS